MKVVKKDMTEENKNNPWEGDSNNEQGGSMPDMENKTKNILAVGLAVSMGLGTLLGGLSLVIFALRDVHLLIELKRNRDSDN